MSFPSPAPKPASPSAAPKPALPSAAPKLAPPSASAPAKPASPTVAAKPSPPPASSPATSLPNNAPPSTSPAVVVSFTFYTASWDNQNTARPCAPACQDERLLKYGSGLLANIESIRELWPEARITVFYARPDDAAARHPPTETFVRSLEAAWSTLTVHRIAPEDLRATVTSSASAMPVGQAMRLTRYFPLLLDGGSRGGSALPGLTPSAGANGGAFPLLPMPVVCRDVDSVFTSVDKEIICQWLAGPSDILCYREHTQGLLADAWVMGGGLASRRAIASASTFLAAAASKDTLGLDEGALRLMLMPHLRAAVAAADAASARGGATTGANASDSNGSANGARLTVTWRTLRMEAGGRWFIGRAVDSSRLSKQMELLWGHSGAAIAAGLRPPKRDTDARAWSAAIREGAAASRASVQPPFSGTWCR